MQQFSFVVSSLFAGLILTFKNAAQSNAYKESANCRLEANYGMQQK